MTFSRYCRPHIKASAVPLSEPSWWYGDSRPLTAKLLGPIAYVYGRVSRRRLLQPPSLHSPLPVICVGNFTAGGTGKTPLAIFIGQLLRELGEQPVYLSRGYGGSEPGPHLVTPDGDTAAMVGDEPLLLASYGPVVISRDRAAGATLINDRSLGSVIIMDDGLQSPALVKDLRLALVDGQRGTGNGRVIPAGPLRAPLDDQLRIVDAVIVNGDASPTTQRLLAAIKVPVLKASLEPANAPSLPLDQPLLAYAGIGNPERFFQTLSSIDGQCRLCPIIS